MAAGIVLFFADFLALWVATGTKLLNPNPSSAFLIFLQKMMPGTSGTRIGVGIIVAVLTFGALQWFLIGLLFGCLRAHRGPTKHAL